MVDGPVPTNCGATSPLSAQGELFVEGETIGVIGGLDGEEVAAVTAPMSGVVHEMFPARVVMEGEKVRGAPARARARRCNIARSLSCCCTRAHARAPHHGATLTWRFCRTAHPTNQFTPFLVCLDAAAALQLGGGRGGDRLFRCTEHGLPLAAVMIEKAEGPW